MRTLAANVIADALVRLPVLLGALGAIGNPTAIASAVVSGLSDLVMAPWRHVTQVGPVRYFRILTLCLCHPLSLRHSMYRFSLPGSECINSCCFRIGIRSVVIHLTGATCFICRSCLCFVNLKRTIRLPFCGSSGSKYPGEPRADIVPF